MFAGVCKHLSVTHLSCRFKVLKLQGITFSANEIGLHEGTGALGSARACYQLETVIVIRDAVDRARSHVTEVMRVIQRWA